MQVQQITNHNQSTKSERLEARVSLELKSRLQKAAELQGTSLSEFISRSAEEAANEIIYEYQILKLSAEDSRAFIDALFNPQRPNRKLRAAFLDYKKKVSSQA